MKYTHIEDELYINITDLKSEIKQQFAELSQQEPSPELDSQLMAINIVWTFFESVLALPQDPTNE